MRVGERVKFTNEAGVEYDALVLFVHVAPAPKPMLDLVYVEPNVAWPTGPAVPIQRPFTPHADAAGSNGKASWREAE